MNTASDAVQHRLADHDVDLVQPVLQDRDGDRHPQAQQRQAREHGKHRGVLLEPGRNDEMIVTITSSAAAAEPLQLQPLLPGRPGEPARRPPPRADRQRGREGDEEQEEQPRRRLGSMAGAGRTDRSRRSAAPRHVTTVASANAPATNQAAGRHRGDAQVTRLGRAGRRRRKGPARSPRSSWRTTRTPGPPARTPGPPRGRAARRTGRTPDRPTINPAARNSQPIGSPAAATRAGSRSQEPRHPPRH